MINQHQFQQSARHFRSGRISLSEFQSRVFAGTETKPHQTKPASETAPKNTSSPNVTLDLDRADRCGWSEVIFGEGKTIETLVEILNQLKTAGQPALITRVSDNTGNELAKQIPDGNYDSAAKTFTRETYAQKKKFNGDIAVVAAGTSDLPVLEEACSTIRWMGADVNRIVDVGVAGPDRLTPHLETLRVSVSDRRRCWHGRCFAQRRRRPCGMPCVRGSNLGWLRSKPRRYRRVSCDGQQLCR